MSKMHSRSKSTISSTSWASWLLFGEWRAHPVRALVAIAAIAIGVTLGFAIHLINAAAFNEFTAAVKSISGQADLSVRGYQARIDEDFYPQLANKPEVKLASPVLELDAAVPGQTGPLKILGLDSFRASELSPDLLGIPAEDKPYDMLADDAVFLSPAAMQWLNLKAGEVLHLRSGVQIIDLRVAGGLVSPRAGQRIAVMDIGAMQWRFGLLGKLSRVDLVLKPGVNREAFKAAIAKEGRLIATETSNQENRTENMSRAYRVNLTVLALVALFTGAFFVFSTQALSVVRRRSQFALLRVIGLTRWHILRQVLMEGAGLGIAGSALGIGGGYLMAALTLKFFGGDLGGGYFPGVQPSVIFTPLAALLFFSLGTAVSLLGCAAPAWEAARAHPAQALKSGSEDSSMSRLAAAWPALLVLAAGGLCSQLPAVRSLPIFGYLSVALLLIGGIMLMPRISALLFSRLYKPSQPAIVGLALARLANVPNQASIALSGVLSSFSLMVAMAIMVASFRVSVDDWLLHILPAPLYVSTAITGETSRLNPAQQNLLATVPGVQKIEFMRTASLLFSPDRPNVLLMARPINTLDPGKSIPILEGNTPVNIPQGVMPVWVSEAMVDLYGYTPGKQIQLPLNQQRYPAIVAGVWRDYARQSGAIAMQISDYRKLTGDLDVSNAAITMEANVQAEQLIQQIRALPFGSALEFAQSSEIRATSLKIFDRSFAITYLLELIAMVIGLFGVAATFSAQTLARAKEFGMLRHIGVTRREILAILIAEGSLLTAIGILTGFVLGWVISLILVFVVNPQSFHWSMQMHMPWSLLFSVAAVMLVASGLTALLAGRQALSGSVVQAVREDW
ncbi:FtsX-like permease family protein [Undibacterium terreum]|uniref:Permease n=1 Tax=Undibacterium terreum TaxID=1224302 RepID=A0A916XGM1_9BURK|nr:FtsX-like permease family protein [Undibacterium terreum]GGC70602.1 permease [Undibacterium terreum]